MPAFDHVDRVPQAFGEYRFGRPRVALRVVAARLLDQPVPSTQKGRVVVSAWSGLAPLTILAQLPAGRLERG